MATAIVALGARENLGEGPVVTALAFIAALLYLLTLLLLVRRRSARSTPRALSFVAASGGLAALAPELPAALLSAAAGAAWLTIAAGGRLAWAPTAPGGRAGGALLRTVATQAVVVAGSAELARGHGAAARDLIVWGGSGLWVVGVALYAALIPSVARGMRTRGPGRPAGDDWIAMGALAISALAASSLSEAMGRLGAAKELTSLAPDLGAVCWIGASVWLAPLLWRERRGLFTRVPWRYGFDRWSTVFPLGMYSVSAASVARALSWRQPLWTISACALAVALAAWLGTAAGGLRAGLARRGR